MPKYSGRLKGSKLEYNTNSGIYDLADVVENVAESSASDATLSYLGNIVAVTTTSTPTYSSFSGTRSFLTGNKTIVLVIQSRDSNASTSNPYTSVTIGGVAATIIPRSYQSGDFNSSCIAYLANTTISGSLLINVSLGANVHEGQANIAVYSIYHSLASVAVSDNSYSSNTTQAFYSTNLTTPSGTVFSFATANVSNADIPVISVSGGGTYTTDVAKDGGTAENYAVLSGSSPENTSLTFNASVTGIDGTDNYSIQAASFGF